MGSPQEEKFAKLTPFHFEQPLTDSEIEEWGARYVHEKFCLRDISDKPLQFCKTGDGLWVYFRSGAAKLLGRADGGGFRPGEASRIRRFPWIIPILEGRTVESVEMKEFLGKDINKGCQPGRTYRIYFVRSKMYCVWLTRWESKRGAKSFNLNSAYRIDTLETRQLFDRLFPQRQ